MPRQPGARAIIAHKGKLLLILRDKKPKIPNPNTWTAPGGGIEPNEGPEDGIKRELQEEICVIPKNLEEGETMTYDDGSVVSRFFSVLTEEEYAQVRLGDEGQRLDWFTYDEAMAADLSPNLRIYFEKKEKDIKELLARS